MKRKNSYKIKKFIKDAARIVCLVLVCAVVVGGVASLFKGNDDDYTRVYPTWYVGQLDDGCFDDSVDTVMVTGYIKINEGIRFEIKENADVMYCISVYDENKNYLLDMDGGGACSSNMTFTKEDFAAEDDSSYYIRVEIQGMTDDNHISILDKIKFGNYLKIFTLKETDSE